MYVQVMQRHIDRGIPQNEKMCPIALALQEAGFESPVVGGSRVKFKLLGGHQVSLDLPAEAVHFITDFDARRPVDEFEFVISGLF